MSCSRIAQRLRILYLEDDPHDAELAVSMLANDGVNCDIVRVDDRGGFAAALAQQRFDLILSDFSLPGFDGMTALEFARARHPEIPFLFFSGTLGEELAIEAVRSGATDYVVKQRPLRLPTAVRRALREAAEHARRAEMEKELRLKSAALEAAANAGLIT